MKRISSFYITIPIWKSKLINKALIFNGRAQIEEPEFIISSTFANKTLKGPSFTLTHLALLAGHCDVHLSALTSEVYSIIKQH